MIKKKILLLSMLLGCSPALAYAQGVDITDAVYRGAEIEFTAAADSGAEIRVTVSQSGGDTADSVFWISEQTADSSGSAKFVFVIPDERSGADTSGEYKILARSDGRELSEKVFYFASAAERKALLDRVNTLTDAAELAGMFGENAAERRTFLCMGVPVSLCDIISDAAMSKCAEKMLAMRNGAFDGETLKAAFLKSFGIEALSVCGSDKTEEVLTMLDMKYGSTAFSELENTALKKWICEITDKNKPFADADGAAAVYEAANILYRFNTARYNELEQLFSDNAAALGISGRDFYRSYCLMNADGKTAVNEAVVKALAAAPATEYTAVYDVLKSAADGYSADVPSGGGTGGGSGGGVSGGGKGNGGGSGGGGSKSLGTIGAPTTAETVFPTAKYTDTDSARWALRAIEALTDAGIVCGTGNGKFEPDRIVTREEFVKMIVLAAKIADGGSEIRFDDVESGSWAEKYIQKAAAAGIITGESDTSFGTGKAITRQDMAVIVCRAGESTAAADGKADFADLGEISDYARESVEKLARLGIIRGFEDGTFRPLERCTRAMAAQVIYNMFFR